MYYGIEMEWARRGDAGQCKEAYALGKTWCSISTQKTVKFNIVLDFLFASPGAMAWTEPESEVWYVHFV